MNPRVLLLWIALSSVAVAQPMPPTPPATLDTATVFALGPVGFGGITSPEERQFQTILALDTYHARLALDRLYASGNPQAMSYALAGMRKLNRTRFAELLPSTRASQATVETFHGCIRSQEPLSTIAADLASGKYDQWLR